MYKVETHIHSPKTSSGARCGGASLHLLCSQVCPHTQKVEAGGSGVQSQIHLHRKSWEGLKR